VNRCASAGAAVSTAVASAMIGSHDLLVITHSSPSKT
jgi:hypothetical protein